MAQRFLEMMALKKDGDGTPNDGGIREKASAFFELSGDAKITLIGNREFIVENYKGITEYGSDLIKINAGRLNVCFCGKNMEIKVLTQELLYVAGSVCSLTFEQRQVR